MTTATLTATPAPDYAAIKTKQRAAWSAGDYAVVGSTISIVGERLCEALDVRSGQRLLDVAAGNGNVTLAAARRWCDVVSTDYVESLLERGRARAETEGLSVEFRQADAEDLPFDDASFDLVTSSFGVMFTPDQATSASELARVCRSGGKIGLANWTPESFVGQIFKTIGSHIKPPAGVKSPALWGTREHLETLFEGKAADIAITEQTYVFRYRSPQHWVDLWREIYGPMQKAFDALDAAGQAQLEADLLMLIERFNVADDGTMVVPAPYLEVVVTRS